MEPSDQPAEQPEERLRPTEHTEERERPTEHPEERLRPSEQQEERERPTDPEERRRPSDTPEALASELSSTEGQMPEPSAARPVRKLWTLLGAASVFLGALPFLYFRSRHLREWEDEGYFANGGLRVLEGEVIYRDFQHNYPPGRSFLVAFLTLVFGHHLAIVRGLWIVLQASAAAIGVLVARRVMPLGFALLAGVTIVMNTAWMNKSSELFLSATILWILVRTFEGRLSSVVAGALLAACGHLRHDVAVFGMFVFPVALGLRVWLARPQASLETSPDASGDASGDVAAEVAGRGPLLSAARGTVGMLLGAAAATVPLVVYLVANGALRTAWRDLLFSGYIANKLLPRPFPPFAEVLHPLASTAFLFWIPVVTYGLGLVLGARMVLSKVAWREAGACVLLITLYGIAVFMQVLPRSDMGHLNKAYVPAHIVGMFLVYVGWYGFTRKANPLLRLLRLAAALFATLLPIGHAWRLGVALPNSVPALARTQHRFVDVEFPRGTVRMMRGPAAKYEPLFEAMRPYAGREGEWLVVYPAGALMNYVFDLPNPLRYDLLRPGEMAGQHLPGELVANHPDVLTEIVARLEETRPRFLLDSSEPTNEEVRALFRQYAVSRGYREMVGGRFRLWVRP